MTFRDASKEFELDCKVRHLSPKTIGNYTKQLRYLENYLSSEFSVLNIEDQYSHILDESRKENARLLENAFYRANDSEPRKKEETNKSTKANTEPDPEVVKQILGDPDMLQLLMKLSKTLGK